MRIFSFSHLRGLLLIPVMTVCLNAQVSIIGELSQDNEAKPGDTYTGSIVVRNDTKEIQEAKVYQTDYSFQADGTNNYGEPGTLPRSNAKWITFSPSYVTLPPNGIMAVNYTVIIPKDTDSSKLVGSYWSMLMVEGIQKGSAESSLPSKNAKAQMGIMQTIRYGIQLVTTVPQTGTKKIKFKSTKVVTKENGKRILDIEVENTGELAMRPEMYVELFNEQGTSIGKFPGVKYRLYPGTSIRQSIDISSVATGTYKALVVVDAGGDDVFGSQISIKF
jgi:hypothetical protein